MGGSAQICALTFKEGFAEKRCGQLPCKVLFTAHFQLSIQFQALTEKGVCGELWHLFFGVVFFFCFVF